MAVELAGTVRMDGDAGPETRVKVQVADHVLRLTAGEDLIGEWDTTEIGIHALNEGFSIRAEGEDFLLRTEDDAALAEEMDLKAASPRIARQVAARHRPPEPEPVPEPIPVPSRVGPIAFALAGALMVVGGTFLRTAGGQVGAGGPELVAGSSVAFWLVFTAAGIIVVGIAYALSIGASWARGAAIVLVLLNVVVFGLAVAETPTDPAHLTAFGFLGGGLAVGVAVLFSGSLEDRS